MTLHPLFGILYAMIAVLIWWSVSEDRLAYTMVYTALLALLFAVHLAYLNDRKRERNHNDDIDWDY
jgi:hypothetical protein